MSLFVSPVVSNYRDLNYALRAGTGVITGATTDDFIAVGTTAPSTYTLPNATLLEDGRRIMVKDVDGNADVNNITITAFGVQTIDGASSTSITSSYGARTFVTYGAQWFEENNNGLSSSSGANTRVLINQVAHGFSAENVLTRTGGVFTLAQADSAINGEVWGLVESVVDVDNFYLLTEGVFDFTGTDNSVYFLDDTTAGLLTTTEPTTTGSISVPLVWTISTTQAIFYNKRGNVVGSASSGWSLSGNSGTTSGTDFVGTTDTTALDFRTDNTVQIRLGTTGALTLLGTTQTISGTSVRIQGSSALRVGSSSTPVTILECSAGGYVSLDAQSTATLPLRFYERTTNGSNYVGFQAPNAITADVNWILPGADGTSGQALVTDGAGTLSWATAGSGWNLNGNTVTALKTIGTIDAFAFPIITTNTTRFTVSAGSATLTSTGNAIITTDTGSSLTLDSLDTGTVSLGAGASAKAIVIGNVTGATSLALSTGTGNFTLDGVGATTYTIGGSTTTGSLAFFNGLTTGALEMLNGNANQTIRFGGGTSSAVTKNIVIGNGTGGSIPINNITIGSNTGTSSLSLNVGSGHFQINGLAASNYDIGSSLGGAGTITLGANGQTGTVTLGQSAVGQLVSINSNDSAGSPEVQIANGDNTGVTTVAIASGNSSAGRNISIGGGVPTGGTTNVNLGNLTTGINSYTNVLGAFTYSRQAVSTTQTLSDNSSFIVATGTITLTLPAGVAGQYITVKNAGTGTVTVSANFDTGTSFPLSAFPLTSAVSQNFLCDSPGEWLLV